VKDCDHDEVIIDHNTGEHICRGCGAVTRIEESLDFGMQVFSFSSVMRPTMPLHTKVHGINELHSNAEDDRKAMNDHYKRIVWLENERGFSMTNAVRQRNTLGRVLIQWCSKLNLPQVVADDAMNLFKKLEAIKDNKKGPIAGRTRFLFAGALIRLAARERGIHRPLTDFQEQFGGRAGRRPFLKYYRFIIDKLDMLEGEIRRREINTVDKEISRICSALQIVRVQPKAIGIYDKLYQKDPTLVVSKNPRSLGGACVYIALLQSPGEFQHTQQAIAKAAGITPTSIRNRAKDISIELGLISTRKEATDVLQQSVPPLQALDEGQAEATGQVSQVKEGDGSQSGDVEMGTQEMRSGSDQV